MNSERVFVCPHFSAGNCRDGKNCTKAHLTEEERNNNPHVDICFQYVNSGYKHDILTCAKSGSLCYHCAYGDCMYGPKCMRRHNANDRFYKFNKKIANESIICERYSSGVWCNGKCNEIHRDQCVFERKLSREGKTCEDGCINGKHQGLEQKFCTEIKPTIESTPIEPIIIEEWSKSPKNISKRIISKPEKKKEIEEPDEIYLSRYINLDQKVTTDKKVTTDQKTGTGKNKKRRKAIEDNTIVNNNEQLQPIDMIEDII